MTCDGTPAPCSGIDVASNGSDSTKTTPHATLCQAAFGPNWLGLDLVGGQRGSGACCAVLHPEPGAAAAMQLLRRSGVPGRRGTPRWGLRGQPTAAHAAPRHWAI